MTYTRLGDICLKICSGGTPTSSNVSYYNGGIPWLNTNEVNFCNIYSTSKTISQKGLDNSAAKYIPVNTVIIAMYGVTAGKSAIAKIPLTTNQACCNLVIDEKQADYRYVYYFLKIQSENLNKLANGGAQQNLNSQIIKRFKIALPSLPVQNHIASILSTYDTLIENNMKRIRLLEKMAENLYKEWFVRFRFPGHENVEMVDGLPKGWKIERYGNIAEIIAGGDCPSNCTNIPTKDNTIPIYSNAISNEGLYGYTDKAKISSKCITVSARGTVGFVALRTTPFVPIVRLLAVIPHKKNIYYLYHNSRHNNLEGNGTSQQQLTKPMLCKRKILMPTPNILNNFELTVEAMYKQIQNLQHQNALLARQRDLLLPRLMSGRLEVRC